MQAHDLLSLPGSVRNFSRILCIFLLVILTVVASSYRLGVGQQLSNSTVKVAPGASGITATTWSKADLRTGARVNGWTENLNAGFILNKGQIADGAGKLADNVLLSAQVRAAQVYITTSGISHYFFDRSKNAHEEEEKQEPRGRKKEREPIDWCRLDMVLQGAQISQSQIEVDDSLADLGVSNYYLPQCPDGVLSLQSYGKVTVHEIYPGIDWVITSNPETGVQNDFFVHPGADPRMIKMVYNGAKSIKVSADSSKLSVTAPYGEVEEGELACYQSESGRNVRGRFAVTGNLVSFALDNYDASESLVIDPPLVWSTYYGGSNYDGPRTIYCDNANGNIYVVGYTASTDLPLQNAGGGSFYQGTLSSGGPQDGFIWKFTQLGVRLWATYYGGSDIEVNTDCTLDNFANLYVCGNSSSTNWPTQTLGGAYFQGTNAGYDDCIIMKFNSSGVRQWATYYGGMFTDIATSLTTDASGKLYVGGVTCSQDFPLMNPGGGAYFQNTWTTSEDAFILRFSALGALEWATFLGGVSGVEEALGIATTATHVYLTGVTSSQAFPTFNPGGGAYFQGTLLGYSDAFISKFTLAGVMTWSTYYGGDSTDYGDDPVVDGSGNLFVNGYTYSTNFPTQNPGGSTYYQGTIGGDVDIFILKFNSSNVRQWATYYGGSGVDFQVGGFGKSSTLDLSGRYYTTGMTASANFPVLNPGGGSFYQGTSLGFNDAIIGQFSNNGTMIWSTYYGGSNNADFGTSVSVSNQGCLFATGESVGPNNLFLANPGFGAYYQSTNAGSDDGYIAKFCGATGACCIDNTCVGASSQAECNSLGGTAFYPNQPCSTTTCSILCNICGKKFRDTNKNGVQDFGELGLAGWTIQLYYWNGPLYATTTTDGSGNYCFNNIPCGAWTVNEQLQANWVQTYPSPNTNTYSIGVGTTISNANFGNVSCGSPDTCCFRPPAGMIAWYPFDETVTGDAHDIASRTQDGWHYFGHFASTPGKVNNAIEFDSSRYVRAYSDPFVQVDTGDFSIDAWIRPSSFSSDCIDYPYKPCAGLPIVDNRRWMQGQSGDNGIMFYIEGSGTSQARLGLAMSIFPAHLDTFETPTAPIVLNQWQHVAVTVKRVGGTHIGTFYYNGEPVGTFTPLSGRIYSTNSPGPTMDIGHGTFLSNFGGGINCAAREKNFHGGMDEVEIFGRSLDPSEVQGIYSAGSSGKCKISCSIPTSVVLCRTATTVTINLTVCNQSASTSIAKFSFAPLASGAGCNFNATGITFSPTNGIVTLLPGQCTSIPVTLSRPFGFVPGNVACFCVTVQDTLTKAMGTCCSRLLASNSWCVIIKNPIGTSPLRVGQSIAPHFTVHNEADSAVNFNYTVMVEGGEHGSEPPVMALNGLPPGVPVTGSLSLMPGEEGSIGVDATLSSFSAMDLESIILEGDVDGDGVPEPLDAVLVQPVAFPDCNRNGIDDSQDILVGTSLDANGNGFPDECEGAVTNPDQCYECGDANNDLIVNISDAVFLISYIFGGGSAPNPIQAGDANCDSTVNISDAVYLIGYIFAGGPQPCSACK